MVGRDSLSRVQTWQVGLLVCFSAGITYFAVASFQFVFDDRTQVLQNPTLAHVGYIKEYFVRHVWSYLPGATATYYRPLFSTWLNLNFHFFERQAAGWHVVLLLVHILVSVYTYVVVARVFLNRTIGLMTGLLFATHPVHVESVAWISGGTDVLVSAFVLAAFLAYRKARDNSGYKQVANMSASLACFACALLMKETALLFPILVLLDCLILYRERRSANAWSFIALPYFLLAGVYCLVRIRVLGAFSHAHVSLPASELFYTLPSVLLSYLSRLFVPVGLSPFYDTPYVTAPDLSHFWIPSIILVAAVGLICLCVSRLGVRTQTAHPEDGRNHCLFFLFWTVLFLIPALDLTVLDWGEIVHDRYLYLPSVGSLAIVAYVLYGAAARIRISQRLKGVAFAALVVLLAAGAAAQSYYWKNDFALYSRGATLAPLNVNAQNNLANLYLDSGDYDRGIALHQKIIEQHPGHADSYFNMGMAYYNQGKYSSAEAYFDRAVRLKPAPASYYYLGLAEFKNGKIAGSEQSLARAAHDESSHPEFHAALGVVYETEGKLSLALQELQTAQRLQPDNSLLQNEVQKIKEQLDRSQDHQRF